MRARSCLFSEKPLKLIEISRRVVGDGAEFHSSLTPIDPLIALARARARRAVPFTCGPDENAHQMFAAAVDQSSDGAAANDIEAAALQWESLIREIPDWLKEKRRKSEAERREREREQPTFYIPKEG